MSNKILTNLLCFCTLITLIQVGFAQQDDSGSKSDFQNLETISYLDRKLDHVLDGLRLLATRQDDLGKQVQRLATCDCHGRNPGPMKSSHDHLDDLEDGNAMADPDLGRWMKLAATIMTDMAEDPLDHDANSMEKRRSMDGDRRDLSHSEVNRSHDSSIAKIFIRLGTMLRGQINSLGKKINQLSVKVLEQSHQIGNVYEHLSYVKDECSLAASGPISNRRSEDNSKGMTLEEPRSYNDKPIPAMIRSSDISMMSNIIVQELGRRFRPNEVDPTVIENWREQISEVIQHETDKVIGKLDNLDINMKHSVTHLSKLLRNRSNIANLTTDQRHNRSSNGEPVVLEFSNINATLSPVMKSNSSSSRWFPGSKIPGTIRSSENETETSERDPLNDQNPKQSCKFKTKLVRPSSCQMLRGAGANCTGKYYVFVNSSIKHVYCEMNMDESDLGGGWTVIMRRIDKSLTTNRREIQATNKPVNKLLESLKAQQVNFNQGWGSYRAGFGQLEDWSEFFIGLDLLHSLTNEDESHELQVDVETENGHELHLRFANFSVSNENDGFEIRVGRCNHTSDVSPQSPCDHITHLNGNRFYIHGESHPADSSSMAKDQSYWGWWTKNATGSTLDYEYFNAPTKPIGSSNTNNPSEKRHIYWPNWTYSQDPIRKLVFKIRRDVRATASLL